MSKQALTIINNSGGFATDDKEGIRNSFAFARHIDFRKKPTSVTILPEGTKETSTTVTALITDMVQLPSGTIIAIDTAGGAYVRTTAGSWSKMSGSLGTTAYGMIYNKQFDSIIVPNVNNISMITDADEAYGGTRAISTDELTANTDLTDTGGVANYTTTTSINEGATHKLEFTPNFEPLESLTLDLDTPGTGDLTVTIHDAENNELSTSTIAAGSLVSGDNEFSFSTSIRMQVQPAGATYHAHVTHDGGGTASTVDGSSAADFSTANYITKASRLVDPTNGFHPIYQFLQYLLIINDRYLTVWEPITMSEPSNLEFQRHRLVFPSGFEGTSGAIWNEYFAVGAEKRSDTNDIEFQSGAIFLWDGTASTYNFVIEVPEGSPYALHSHRGILYWFAGGTWWAWNGGDPVAIFQLPKSDTEFSDTDVYTRVYPHMMAVRNKILLGGYPSETNNQNIEHAIYSYGSRNLHYPDSFGESYTISTGTYTYDGSNDLKIGCIKSFGDKLFIAWQDDSQSASLKFGVDIIDNSSDPFGTATWESLIFDNNRADKDKESVKMVITFAALPTGATVTPKYKINRGSWVKGTDGSNSFQGTATETKVEFPFSKRFKEIQLGYDLVATTTTPEIISVTLIYDDMRRESD